MKAKSNLKITLLLIILAVAIGCDQVSKTIVRQKIATNENISLIKNHFTLTKVENTGAFLSLGNNMPAAIRFILLSLLPVLVLVYGIFYLLKNRNLTKNIQLALCFILGGGIGNVIDRLIYGSVTDFLHLDFGFFRTGIFNLADVAIMLGVGILFASSIKKTALAQ